MKKTFLGIVLNLVVVCLLCSMAAPDQGESSGGSVLVTLISSLIILALFALVIFIEIKIGKAIGSRLNPVAGLILGIVLIIPIFTLIIGICIIIHSNKREVRGKKKLTKSNFRAEYFDIVYKNKKGETSEKRIRPYYARIKDDNDILFRAECNDDQGIKEKTFLVSGIKSISKDGKSVNPKRYFTELSGNRRSRGDYEELERDKGYIISKPRDNYVVIDIETTGLNPVHDEIIEIGAVRVEGNVITDSFSTLCKPEKRITAEITSINGITNKMVAGAPSVKKHCPILLPLSVILFLWRITLILI
jgi:energy-coupling factor transporter transmembrane protein EcfT